VGSRARVPEDFYEEIKAAAQRSGRTMSEEIVWRARQTINVTEVVSGHYYDDDGRLVPYPRIPTSRSTVRTYRDCLPIQGSKTFER
jgi:hypothetical protein